MTESLLQNMLIKKGAFESFSRYEVFNDRIDNKSVNAQVIVSIARQKSFN